VKCLLWNDAGTNFLTRSQAFEEVGWSPTYTLTEDYALGMELTMAKWQCRYVEQYLAVGEAPEQLRNCFQQRSRWCKVGRTLAAGRLNIPGGGGVRYQLHHGRDSAECDLRNGIISGHC
jgi:hypothetical protein